MGRSRSRRSGLTIYLLNDGACRESAQSRAFPGWTGAEIHAALNEETLSARTSAVLERVGTVLGEREGTGPRWVKPMDYVVMPEAMVARCNPIQRQLLGAVSDPLSYYLPKEADVPLKALVERNGRP